MFISSPIYVYVYTIYITYLSSSTNETSYVTTDINQLVWFVQVSRTSCAVTVWFMSPMTFCAVYIAKFRAKP